MSNELLFVKLNRAIYTALIKQGKIIEGINCFENYLNTLNAMLLNNKLKSEAESEISLAIYKFSELLKPIAQDYFDKKDFSNATICYTCLIKYNSNDIDVIKNCIKCIEETENYDIAIEILAYTSLLADYNTDLCKTMAELYDKHNDNNKSVEYMQKYTDTIGVNASAQDYNLLAHYYFKLYKENSFDINDALSSVKYFEKAYEMQPENKMFKRNLTIITDYISDFDKCKKYWNLLLENNFEELSNDDKYDYAAFCLKIADFEGFYKYFDCRFEKEHNATGFPKIKGKIWKGENLENSTLLIHKEQGFGDTILMYGYIPRIAKMAKHIIFVVQDNLYSLLKDNTYGVEILSDKNINLNKLKYDYYIPSMSIPIVLKVNKDNISVGSNFIKADEQKVKTYKEKYFNNNKLKIGISYSGASNGDHTRDINIKEFLPLDSIKNIEIYSLIKEAKDGDFECFKHNRVINLGKTFNSFADTAAAIENLDLLITGDNCIMNLSGALGKKTYCLFNHKYQFRWFDLTGENIVWLTSVKPYMNDKLNNWEYSINNVINDIKSDFNL